ncbi:MAG: hypothetical protein PVH64_12905 [Bacillota bacterium]
MSGHNYGQGSSREHAALAPKYLGIKAVLVKSFARIHLQNLVNFGIVPLIFENEEDYEAITLGDQLQIENLRESVKTGEITVRNLTRGSVLMARHSLTGRQRDILMAGGLLRSIVSK